MASTKKLALMNEDEFPFMKTSWYRFAFKRNAGWTMNTILATSLFFCYGLDPLLKYQYSDSNLNENGTIVSGPSGSGVVVITVGLFLLSISLYGKLFFDFISDPKNFVAPTRKPKVVVRH